MSERRKARVARGRRRLQWRVALAAVLIVFPAGVSTTSAVFTRTTTTNATIAAAATFPTYPQQVVTTGPAFYHRGEEAFSGGATVTAADGSGNNRAGAYNGPVDGPATWWKLNENSGVTAIDASGAANPGTLTGGPTWSTRVTGPAVAFDGTDDRIEGTRAAVRTDTSFTVSAWAYLSSTTGKKAVISQDGTNTSGFVLQYDSTVSRWAMSMPGSDIAAPTWLSAVSINAPTLNTWVHLVGVYDDAADQIRLYVDGALEDTTTRAADWNAAGPVAVGRAQASAAKTSYFPGRIDDPQIYRRALTGVEVAAMDPTLATNWAFDEGSGTTVADDSGRNNTGTLTSGPTWNATGVNGAAVTLDGTNDYVVGTASAAHTNASFTVSAWVYLTSNTADNAAVTQAGTTSSGFMLKYDDSSDRWEFALPRTDIAAPTVDAAASSAAPTLNSWVHLTGVYDDDANESILYVDGVPQPAVSHSLEFDATGALNVGRTRWNSSYTNWWHGSIDDVRVYSTALTSEDVSALYSAPAVRWEFDETSGTSSGDATGNRNAGALVNGAAFNTSGHASGGVSLDGTNDAVLGNAPVRTDTSFTVSAWVYLSAKTSNRTVLSQAGTLSSGFVLRYDSSVDRWRFVLPRSDIASPTLDVATSTASPALNTWTHVVGVYDDAANAVRMYVNGVAQTAGTHADVSEWNATGELSAGRARANGAAADHLSGRLDQASVTGRALSAANVSSLYTYTANFAPKLAWDLDEGTGTSTADSSNNGRTGTLSSSSAWTSSGHTSKAFLGNGSSYYATAGTPALNSSTSFTVSSWVYLTSVGNYFTAVSQSGTNISGFYLQYEFNANKWSFSMRSTDSNSSTLYAAMSPGAPTLNTWTHLAGVYDDTIGQMRLYLNGALVSTTTYSGGWNATGAFEVGRARYGAAPVDFFAGRIDDVRAYQRPLTGTEITDISIGTARAAIPLVASSPATFSAQQPGALQGAQQGQQAATAIAFGGAANAFNPIEYSNPSNFTLECWFKSTGSQGGSLMGFSLSSTGMGAEAADRHLFVDSGGRLSFFTYPGTAKTVRSPLAYNDGAWHHVVASLGASGMRLHVDGALVASDAAVTSAQNSTGYWRWGGATLAAVGGTRPASDYFIGTMDEVAVYTSQLTDQQIALNYHADH